ncbi:hypothetical protein GGR54DRAFT_611621 [Hypoxylon sp. NC1633]|nr:hypothetical protein GGR54DRAFT_611621 [Hypoxylon sp. NC1633]
MSIEQSLLSAGKEHQESTVSRVPSKDPSDRSRHSFASYTNCEDDLPDVLSDMDDQCAIEEATVMDAREVTIETPRLPEKSALRASRFLCNLKIKTTDLMDDPHNAYLSSEEDASSSADDFSDYDYDSDSDESHDSPMRRGSQEDTARAVSVIFIGRPCIVDLASGRRSVSPIRTPRTRSSSPSISTTSSETRPRHPPRNSSLTSTIDMTKESPSFLNQDPFAASNYKLESSLNGATPAGSSPRIPRTPTAAFQRFQKSLSLVRKRSRPNLKDAASRDSLIWASVSGSNADFLSSTTSRTSEEERQSSEKPEEPHSAITTPPRTPVTYNSIVTSARRNSIPRVLTKPPPSPSPVGVKRGLLSGLNINRRRSIRIKP